MAKRQSFQQLVRSEPGEAIISLLTDVADFLAAGIGADEIMSRIGGALKQKLDLVYCRVWVRTPDGSSFRAIVPASDEVPSPEEFEGLWSKSGDAIGTEVDPTSAKIYHRLEHDEEFLGLLEAEVGDGDREMAHAMVAIVAKIISPLLGSMELSEDLATEVAFRTREIEDQRRFMSKILDSLPHGLYVIDKDYIIQAWNQKREAGTQGVDREDALGRNVFDVLHRQPRTLLQDEFDTVFSTGGLTQMEVESTASEEPRFYRITKIPMRISDHEVTHVITIGEDMTESRRIRERVAQTEKLAAVGQLAAGVMHEINNPLATIGACIEALSVRVPELPHTSRNAFEEYMKIIDSELDRCKSIIDGLLDFSRPRARIRNPVEVNQIVEDSIFLAKHHQKFKRIKLSVDLERELPMINANAEQLIQAFLAIMINAIDAMEGSGELRVATHALNHSGEVVISFADSGPGIPREDVTKIFEPFYTTKEPGGGTGLGLSICYGIIQQHNGVLQVDSNAGRGAVFSVVLPTAASEAAEASA